MRFSPARFVLLFPALLLWLFPNPAGAFEDPFRPGTKEFGIWAGFSPSSPTLFGNALDRQLALLGLRFGYFFGRSGRVRFEYTADLVPVAIVLQPAFGSQFVKPPPGVHATGGRSPVYGFGFAPVGFKFNLRPRKLSPFLALSGGMIYTTEPVPVTGPDTTRLNFMFDFGGGLQWVFRPGQSLIFGYKLHHISNANRTSVNPGMDSNVIYVGYSFLR